MPNSVNVASLVADLHILFAFKIPKASLSKCRKLLYEDFWLFTLPPNLTDGALRHQHLSGVNGAFQKGKNLFQMIPSAKREVESSEYLLSTGLPESPACVICGDTSGL